LDFLLRGDKDDKKVGNSKPLGFSTLNFAEPTEPLKKAQENKKSSW
jgi:hypothetical protein